MMLRKSKASKIAAPALFTLVLFVSWFLPIQPTSIAQVNDCPGNLVVNGNFASGLSPWTAPYGTPDYSAGIGCQDPGYVGMWGNQNSSIGEALTQAVSLVAGKIYIGSVCFRAALDPNKQQNGSFRVRATTVVPTSWGLPGTVYVSPLVPASLTWNHYFFAFQAPPSTNYLTINVENNLNANDGAKTTYGHIDNVCIQELDFKPTKACQGQAISFTSNAGSLASWDWDFGDGAQNNQQNPTHTYTQAGTFQVKLCVNGTTTNCVTKTVTVSAPPPAPIITGSSKPCGLPNPVPYSVAAQSGVTYSWSVTNGTFAGNLSTGNNVGVNWNSTGVGVITVTATNKAGCTSSTRFRVELCDANPGDCCLDFNFQEKGPNFVSLGGGLYNFTMNITAGSGNIIGVTANVISSSLTYSPASCGVAGPVNSYVVSASPLGSLNALVQPPNGHEVSWQGGSTSINNQNVQMQIKFPPLPTGGCKDFLTFCIKYSFTDNKCKTCSVIRCYGPFKRGGGPDPEDPTKQSTQ